MERSGWLKMIPMLLRLLLLECHVASCEDDAVHLTRTHVREISTESFELVTRTP